MKTFHDLPTISTERAKAGKLYQEFLRVPALSAGVYLLAAGATDAAVATATAGAAGTGTTHGPPGAADATGTTGEIGRAHV